MSDLVVRSASKQEFSQAVEWAIQEGWNPGHDDLEAFYLADPGGFLMGWLDDVAVSSISVVRYSDDFGFLGFYIVRPEYRGRGFGLETWNAGIAHLGDRAIALDGVAEQQSNYQKSGFDYFARNIRYAGKRNMVRSGSSNVATRRLRKSDLTELIDLDLLCFPADRSAFISHWCLATDVRSRVTHVAELDDTLVGFGTIRSCREGYKIGPLFARSQAAASALLNSLSSVATPDSTIILDVPETNNAAVNLALRNGLEPVFETARMHRGRPNSIHWDKVFGITSFELG